MPIRPENVARYPKNWKCEVVPRIAARSKGQCECTGQCGQHHFSPLQPPKGLPQRPPMRCQARNGEMGAFSSDGYWHRAVAGNDVADVPDYFACPERGQSLPAIKIVLTVAHLNHMPEDCRDENLLHLCQRCHNRYDAPTRRRGIQERAKALRAAGDLFAEAPQP
jgi:hypothetical protein